MKKTIGKVLITAALLTVGCDSAPDPGEGPLLGIWQRFRDDGSVRSQYKFGTDRSFSFDEFKSDDPTTEDHLTGTYQVSDGVMVVEVTQRRDGTRARLTFTYFANATVFSAEALRPIGNHDRIVGTWSGTVHIDPLDDPASKPDGGMQTFELRADGTFEARTTAVASGTSTTWGGTYAESQGMIQLTAAPDASNPGLTRTATLQIVDDIALVSPGRTYRRQ